jgi:ATP-dependent DNA ligase
MLPRPPNLPAGFIPPCLPIKAPKPPSGALWLHEIKHDGFRVIARKEGERVRLSWHAWKAWAKLEELP